MKAQVSTELLIMVAAILVLFIPLLVITYFKASETNEHIMQLQAQVVAIRLSELANAVGGSAGNSTIIAEVYVPSSVKSIEVKSAGDGGELTLHSETQTGPNEISGLIKFKLKDASFSFSTSGMVRFEISKDEDGAISIKRLG